MTGSRSFRASVFCLCLLVIALATHPAPALAQEIRYIYDSLNRLVGVVDQQGNAAEYVYDAVGNLLQIRRYTVDTGATVGITLVTPGKGPEGATVEIFGQGFSANLAEDTVRFNGVLATVTEASATRLRTTVPTGATTGVITVTAPLGSATSPEPFTVLAPITVSPPTVSLLPGMTQQFTATAPVIWSVNGVRGGNATLGTITPEGLYTTPRAVPAASGVTVTAAHVDEATLKGTASVSLGAGPEAVVAALLSVMRNAPPPQASPLLATAVSVARDPVPADVTPLVAAAVSVAKDPLSVSAAPLLAAAVSVAKTPVPTSAAPLAATPVSVSKDPSPVSASPQVAALVSVSREPVVTGVTPTSAAQGTSLTVTLTGAGFAGATAVSFERNGTVDSTVTVTDLVVAEGGAQATCTVTIATGAAAGDRVVRITTPGTTSSAAGIGTNVFTVTVP